MEREVRYCTTEDGVRIAYRVQGEGPVLVACPLFVESFTFDGTVPSWQSLMGRLGEGRQLIRYDMRGTGLSQRAVGDYSHEALVLDLEAVVKAANVPEFALWAGRTSGARAIEYCVRHPERCTHLVLYGSLVRGSDLAKETIDAFSLLAGTNWDLAAQVFAEASGRGEDPEGGLQVADLFRQSAAGAMAAKFIRQACESTDVSAILTRVECRALILQRMRDNFARFEIGQEIAAKIPDAQLVPLNESKSAFGDIAEVVDQIEEFLGGRTVGPSQSKLDRSAKANLTKREPEILALVAAGLTSSEISRELTLSVRTVGRHITNIYNKIGARGAPTQRPTPSATASHASNHYAVPAIGAQSKLRSCSDVAVGQ